MDYLIEPAQKVPVVGEVDVAVAGGGISGMIASIAAARQGARVLVVDRFGALGGNMGPGMFAGGTLHLALKSRAGDADEEALVNRMGMGGLPEEFCRRVVYARPDGDSLSEDQRQEIASRHGQVSGLRVGSDYIIDSQVVPYVASQMMREAGVEMMLSTWVAGPVMEGRRVRGFYVETKSGRQAVRAKLVVDATGDADVALRAGAPITDLPSDPGIGVFYALGDVDWPKYQLYVAEAKNEPAPDDIAWLHRTMLGELGDENGDPTMPAFHHLLPFIRSAWETGEFKFIRSLGMDGWIITRAWKAKRHGLVNSRAESAGRRSPGDARRVSLLERELRDYAFELSRFLRRHVPGFEQCYLHAIAPYMGARGGRNIESERVVTGEDIRSAARFDDVIYIYYDEGCAGCGCDVPYRTLVPREIDGLLAVGRSAVRRSPNLRQRWSVMLMAQAGGIAAAMCAAQGVEPRHLDVKALQKVLVQLGCPLGDRERLIELGLA